MEIKSALRAAGAAFAIALAAPAAARERGETVAPHFERVIPNIPGKSLVAVVVDYAPGGASLPHTHAKSAFVSPTSCPAQSSHRSTISLSGSTTPARVGTRHPVPAIASAVMQARPSPQNCSRFSSSIPRTRP